MSSQALPEILAPAGDMPALLAALAAGADAVYAGLKHFSARMQAENFSVKDLARAAELCDQKGARLYVALNTLLKPGDLDAAGRLIHRLALAVKPQALIVQDLACLDLARQAGYEGELHLSTLANCSHQAGLPLARAAGANRVVLPRELNIDEIKDMAAACPEDPDFGLEVFVHGALCFCVSGRCYWSSYLGGKSGLRGRCVQPCRRVYEQKGRKARFFSCQDLSLDVLVKSLLAVPRVRAWKIEGRKKTPHYVYYTVSAYKMLRDSGQDPQARKTAEEILQQALGRPATHYTFLPQRPHQPVSAAPPDAPDSGSGQFAGRVSHTPEGKAYLKPRMPLIKQDLLRIGHEDEPWHRTMPVRKAVPKAGRLDLFAKGAKPPKKGTPVYLIDRREPPLMQRINALKSRLDVMQAPPEASRASEFTPRLPAPLTRKPASRNMRVLRELPKGKSGKSRDETGLWLHENAVEGISRTLHSRLWWWLPPVIWPAEEKGVRRLVQRLLQNGARRFVCNQPWQAALFPEGMEDLQLTAGPFCNTANALALGQLARLGFTQAVVSPELEAEAMLALPAQSPLPLGVVVAGEWPVGLSRVEPQALAPLTPFVSPMKEPFWTRRYGRTVWLFPGWPLDLGKRRAELQQAGYTLFISLHERRPKELYEPERTGEFNWELQLL